MIIIRFALQIPLWLALSFGLAVGAASAQEFVMAKGRLSDDDFYRLVTCAAPPGGECQKDVVRWSAADAKDLAVRLVQVDEGYPRMVLARVEEQLSRTLADLNAVGAGVRVSEAAEGTKPNISIFLLDLPRDSAVAGTGLPWFDGHIMQAARMQLGWHQDGTAFVCAIALSRDVTSSMVPRILIEEITQCLGLMTDIGGHYYSSRSIFSEEGNARSMGQQDVMALRRHYP